MGLKSDIDTILSNEKKVAGAKLSAAESIVKSDVAATKGFFTAHRVLSIVLLVAVLMIGIFIGSTVG